MSGLSSAPNAGLVLAAGAGRRYGRPKAFAPVPPGPGAQRAPIAPPACGPAGELMLERAVRTLHEGGCAPVIVVLGAEAHRGRPLRLEQRFGARLVVNPDWPSGMGSSLRAGLAALPASVPAVVVMLVDTPDVTADAVRRVGAYADPTALRVATYGGRPGHPVLIGRAHWAGVADGATGDTGARRYLAAHDAEPVPCDDVADGADVDVRHA
ncbi:nucleotidyltransferase family protein [Micromonospora sp. CPCC 206060]|uniref:nucleotidyltransferase family protein n=1 Tax=Micromonospora sp. CPCC 206060 TaxID=3122406 RepID=UPI002FEFB79F